MGLITARLRETAAHVIDMSVPAAESPQDSERPFADFGGAARHLDPSQEIVVCSVDII